MEEGEFRNRYTKGRWHATEPTRPLFNPTDQTG